MALYHGRKLLITNNLVLFLNSQQSLTSSLSTVNNWFSVQYSALFHLMCCLCLPSANRLLLHSSLQQAPQTPRINVVVDMPKMQISTY